MSKWTQEEIDIALDAQDEFASYQYMQKTLKENGYNRSTEAIRKMLKRYCYPTVTNTRKEEKLVIPPPVGPKVLFTDIETLPIVSYTWGLRKQNIGISQILRDWCMLSWSAKWLNDSEVYSDVLTSEEALNRNDTRITHSIWQMINDADIIVAHNGDNFDIKKLKTRFLLNGLPPTSLFTSIDTLKQSRKNFGFTSNKLDFLTEIMFMKNKIKTDFELWKKCDMGDKEALTQMVTYNKYDVVLLEDVYYGMLPWMTSLPNFALYINTEEMICGHCGSTDIVKNGFYFTPANKFQSYQCKSCGCFMRDRVSAITKAQKNKLLINLSK